MGFRDRIPAVLSAVGARAVASVRAHPRVAGTAASALAGTAAVLARRRTPSIPQLPSASTLAASTAISVHNAAKATVIASIDEDAPESRAVILQRVRTAVEDASSSGVDVTSAALGAIEGSVIAADRLGLEREVTAREAAREAHAAAARLGFVAAARVEDALAPLLSAPERGGLGAPE